LEYAEDKYKRDQEVINKFVFYFL